MDLGVAVALALVGGIIAVRLRQPPIVGYLLAGVVIGPFTPGFVGDAGADQRARRGRRRPPAVRPRRRVLAQQARPGAPDRRPGRDPPGRSSSASWRPASAIPIGLPRDRRRSWSGRRSRSAPRSSSSSCSPSGASSTASTAARRSAGWSSRTCVTILLIALLEPFAAGGDLAGPVAARAAAHRAVPRPRLRRRHADAAVAVPVGQPARIAGAVPAHRCSRPRCWRRSSARRCSACSLALGAFVAGLIVSESELRHQAAGEITPFRDLFAVLFFVSVGMLLDPAAMVADWPALLALLRRRDGRQGGGERRPRAAARAAAAQRAAARRDDRPGRRVQLPARRAGAARSTCSTRAATTSCSARPSRRSCSRRSSCRGAVRLDRAPRARPLGVDAAGRGPGRLQPRRAGAPRRRGRRRGPARGRGAGRRPGRAGRRSGPCAARGFRCVVVDRDPHALDEAATTGAATLFGDAASLAILRRAGLDGRAAARDHDRRRDDGPARGGAGARDQPAADRRSRGRAAGPRRARLQDLGVTRLADPEIEAAIELARASLARMGVSGPEQAAVTVGLRRRHYGERRSEPAAGRATGAATPRISGQRISGTARAGTDPESMAPHGLTRYEPLRHGKPFHSSTWRCGPVAQPLEPDVAERASPGG